MDAKDKSVTSNTKGQNTKRDFSTLCPAIQCNKYQDYRHAADIFPSPVKVAKVGKPPVTNPKALPPLLPFPIIVVCSGRQPFPPLLSAPSPFRIVIDKLSITELEWLKNSFTRWKNLKIVSDEIHGDDIEEFSTSIPPEAIQVIIELVQVTSVTTEFIDVSPKDSFSISPQTHPCDCGDYW